MLELRDADPSLPPGWFSYSLICDGDISVQGWRNVKMCVILVPKQQIGSPSAQ